MSFSAHGGLWEGLGLSYCYQRIWPQARLLLALSSEHVQLAVPAPSAGQFPAAWQVAALSSLCHARPPSGPSSQLLCWASLSWATLTLAGSPVTSPPVTLSSSNLFLFSLGGHSTLHPVPKIPTPHPFPACTSSPPTPCSHTITRSSLHSRVPCLPLLGQLPPLQASRKLFPPTP